jgi:hypothetical protein
MTITANIAREILQTSQNIKNIHNEFNQNIFENKFFNNIEYLLSESVNIEFQSIWTYNPHRFCLDQYDNMNLYPVILLINNVNSIFEFKSELLNNIIVTPTSFSIYKVLSLTS